MIDERQKSKHLWQWLRSTARKARERRDVSQYLLHILSDQTWKIFLLYSQLMPWSDADVIEEEILNIFFISSLMLSLNNLLVYL